MDRNSVLAGLHPGPHMGTALILSGTAQCRCAHQGVPRGPLLWPLGVGNTGPPGGCVFLPSGTPPRLERQVEGDPPQIPKAVGASGLFPHAFGSRRGDSLAQRGSWHLVAGRAPAGAVSQGGRARTGALAVSGRPVTQASAGGGGAIRRHPAPHPPAAPRWRPLSQGLGAFRLLRWTGTGMLLGVRWRPLCWGCW